MESKGKRRGISRAVAWCLSVILVLSLVNVPMKVKAESLELDLNPDTSEQTVTIAETSAEMRFTTPSGYSSLKALADAGYSKFQVSYQVSGYTSDGTAGAMAFVNYGASWKNGDTWKNLSDGSTGTITLDFSAISKTDTQNATFGIQFANVTGSITYRITSAKLIGDSNSAGSGSTGGSGEGEEVTAGEVTVSATENRGNDYWTEWTFSITNNKSESITGVQVVLPVSLSPAGLQSFGDITAVYDSNVGGIVVYYAGTIGAGATVSSSDNKIGFNPQNVTVSSAYVKSVNCGAPTGSGGGMGDGSSDLATDIEYNYAKLLQESLYFYDANMCGSDVNEKSELAWRSDCHTADATVIYEGQIVDVSGGYHDAGDHAKFGLPQAYAASTLGMSYYEFKEAFTDLGLTEHYKRIADRFADYFKRCTVLDNSGNVKAFCYQVGSGNTDHNYWGAPENQASRADQAWFTSASTPCTDIVCETAAALAIHYCNFGDTEALDYAEKLFAYANSMNKAFSVIETDNATGKPFYTSTCYDDDYALAAAWLYKATKDTTYKAYYNNMYGSKNYVGWTLSWDDVGSAAMLYAPDDTSRREYVSAFIKNNSNKMVASDNNYFLLTDWGSARYNCATQMIGLMYDKMSGNDSFGEWSMGQMKYLLGNNAGKHAFVVGYNKYSVEHPHHRAASGYYDVSSNGTTKMAHVLVGALVGGPNVSSTAYVDTATDYNQNEVALDYNAGLVGAAAGLYLYTMANGTEEEKAVQKVVSSSEVSSELRSIAGAVEPSVPETYDISTATIASIASYKYTGSAITPELTVTYGDTTLTKGTDYTVSYTNNVNVGTATVTITGKGSYSKTKTATFVITKADGVKLNQPSVVVNGTDSITITTSDYSSEKQYAVVAAGVAVSDSDWKDFTGNSVTHSGLTVNTRYDIYVRVKGNANINAGVSSDVQTVTTDKYDISESVVSVTANSVYTGGNIEPVVTVLYTGHTLVEVIDYQVSYSNNVNVGTATVTITGKGNYKGINTTTFKIDKTTSITVAKPMLESKTANSLTITLSEEGITKQYAVVAKGATPVDADWKDYLGSSVTVSGLKEFTYYDIYARAKGDNNHKVGAKSEVLTAFTLLNNPYVIDVSKITSGDCDYVNALKSGGIDTITVEEVNGKVTIVLVDTEKSYTITGNNENATIVTNGTVNVILANAVIDSMKVDGQVNATLSLVGANQISSGIFVTDSYDTTNEFTITSAPDEENGYAGSLTVIKENGTAIVSEGSVNIAGGKLTLMAKNHAISASNINVTGGSIDATVTGEETAFDAYQAIELTGGEITLTKPDTNTAKDFSVSSETGSIVVDGVALPNDIDFSVDPVDKNGEAVEMITVTFVDEDGIKVLKTVQAKKNSTLSLSDVVVTKEGYALSWTVNGVVATALTVTEAVTVKAKWTMVTYNLSKAVVADIINKTYTGNPHTPAVTVTYNNKVLGKDIDYTVAYRDNVNVGTATVTISGIGFYTGVITKTFTIEKANHKVVAKPTLGAKSKNSLTIILSDEGVIKQYAIVTKGTTVTEEDWKDYSGDSVTIEGLTASTNYDIYARAKADNNHNVGAASEALEEFTLGADSDDENKDDENTDNDENRDDENTGNDENKDEEIIKKDIAYMTATLSATAFDYNGQAIKPVVILKDGYTTLVEDIHYSVTYINNVNPGTATVVIVGKGEYVGQLTLTFTIKEVPTAVSIEDVDISEIADQQYTGKPITPALVLSYAGTVLTLGTDYEVQYKNNVNIGEATVVISGKGEYVGVTEESFDIIIKKNKKYTKGNYQYQITSAKTNGKGTVQLIKCVKKAKTVNIAATVNIGGVNFRITSIKSSAFKNNKTMTKLVIGKYVTTIGDKAFYGCTKLKNATLGKGVKKIGKQAFYNCKAMRSFVISSSSLKSSSVGSKAFTKMGASNYKKLVVKVPSKKLSAYKKLLKKKGLSSKAKIKK